MNYYNSFNNNYNKAFENKEINKKLTFEGLREIGRKASADIVVLRDRNKAELDEIKTKGIYAVSYIQNKQKEFAAEEERVANECIENFKKAYKEVLETKRNAVDDMLATAPTQEQLNLLQSLQMQGNSLTKEEIAIITPKLSDNYRAIKTLQTIAKKIGFNVILPPQFDFDEINTQLKYAENYLEERANDLKRPKLQWHLDSDCFFGPPEYPDNRWNAVVEVLDGTIQTTPVIEPVKKLTETETTILKNVFADKQGEELTKAVTEAAKSPNMADLISRSEYAEHITETE